LSSALIGVIGVAAGALATGGVQAYLNARERRINAVASARLLWVELRWTCITLQETLKHGAWPLEQLIAPTLQLWEMEKKAMSRATNNREFERLAGAIAHLKAIEFWSVKDKGFTAWGRQKIEIAAATCIRGRVTAYIAGEPFHRRALHRWRFSKAEAKGELYEPDVSPGQAWRPIPADGLS
jgi:hypothetical protein